MAHQTWTDPSLPGVKVKYSHLDEISTAINNYQTHYGVSIVSSISSAVGTKVVATGGIVDQMKAALDTLYHAAAGVNFNNWPAEDNTKVILTAKQNLTQIRSNMNFLQDNYCITCDTCNAHTACSCDQICYSQSCTTCNSTCDIQTTGVCRTCNNVCYSQHGAGWCAECGVDDFGCGN